MVRPRIAVIGAGFFGCHTALEISTFADVTLFERNEDIMLEASLNNQWRLHTGFHYPRDDETVKQSQAGLKLFESWHGDSLISYPSYYCIAEEDSRVTASDYIEFISRNGMNATECGTPPGVLGVSLTVLTDERVIDCSMASDTLRKMLKTNAVLVETSCDVTGIFKACGPGHVLIVNGQYKRFDIVVDCTYSGYGVLTKQLGHETLPLEYRYTVLPVVKLDLMPQSITLMDGDYWSLSPQGRSGLFLLSSVSASNTFVTGSYEEALDLSGGYDQRYVFESILDKVSPYYPKILEAEHQYDFSALKTVLANKHVTDARPTKWHSPETGFYAVLGGKINHSVLVAKEIAASVKETING